MLALRVNTYYFKVMKVASFIANRLSLLAGADRCMSPGVIVASGGLALSLAVMIIAIAVTSGFKEEITDKISGIAAQIRIAPLNDDGITQSEASLLKQICRRTAKEYASKEGAEDVAEVSTVAGILKTNDDFAGIAFKSYGQDANQLFEHSILTEGNLPQTKNQIAISEVTANTLQIQIGDKVNAYFIAGDNFRPRRLIISGIFNSNFGEFDKTLAYARDSLVLPMRGNHIDAIEIRGINNEAIERANSALQVQLNRAFSQGQTNQLLIATPITSSAAGYFNWLEMLDTNIVVILVLMGCVSAFMIISCILILVLQRVKMIGILKSLGATNRRIESIFSILGARVVIIGMLIGNTVSLGLLALQYYLKIIPLDPASYYLNSVPVSITFWQWAAVNIGFGILAVMITMLPALLVRRLSPAKTMRWNHE